MPGYETNLEKLMRAHRTRQVSGAMYFHDNDKLDMQLFPDSRQGDKQDPRSERSISMCDQELEHDTKSCVALSQKARTYFKAPIAAATVDGVPTGSDSPIGARTNTSCSVLSEIALGAFGKMSTTHHDNSDFAYRAHVGQRASCKKFSLSEIARFAAQRRVADDEGACSHYCSNAFTRLESDCDSHEDDVPDCGSSASTVYTDVTSASRTCPSTASTDVMSASMPRVSAPAVSYAVAKTNG